MVEATLRVVDDNVAYTAVHATRGKVMRAEPVTALYEQGRIRHMGAFTTELRGKPVTVAARSRAASSSTPLKVVVRLSRNGRSFGPIALASLHRLRRDDAGEAPQFSRATSGARNSRNTGDHLACSGPLEEWPRSLSSSK